MGLFYLFLSGVAKMPITEKASALLLLRYQSYYSLGVGVAKTLTGCIESLTYIQLVTFSKVTHNNMVISYFLNDNLWQVLFMSTQVHTYLQLFAAKGLWIGGKIINSWVASYNIATHLTLCPLCIIHNSSL